LGKKGGAFIPLKNLTKYGLGGKQGLGNQKVSWIHETDFARAVEFLLTHEHLEGIFNLSVPNPTNNKTLMKTLRQEMKISFGIPHPKWLLEIGAKIIGTETELILKSRNVIPERLLQSGFTFKYTNIQTALNNLLL
jgi:NAD dependent epimerase/dehydratase family enzyme